MGIGSVRGFVVAYATSMQDHSLGAGCPQAGYLEKTENEIPFVSKMHRIPSSLYFLDRFLLLFSDLIML